MIRIHQLLAQRQTNPAAAILLLLVVAFRLLLPPGLMLSQSTGSGGNELTICSGHGALFDNTSAISADPALKVAAKDLAEALDRSTQLTGHQHTSDLCPFSTALAICLATTLLFAAHWLGIVVSATIAHPADDVVPAAAPTHGLLGARAPPCITLV
ncbi:hypothetical protein SAMN05445504_7653 [Burkholderia sp. CF099]|jgi:hypothetical protein|nr:hypothetical protein SAMN05445504_7653 [Burkholderia sp. CF099]